MALPPQVTEEEFREFARRHFPGAPQPTRLPSWVTPCASPQPAHENNALDPNIVDTAYNGGFNYGHHAGYAFGHATGYKTGFYAGYQAGYAAGRRDAGLNFTAGAKTRVTGAAEPVAAVDMYRKAEDTHMEIDYNGEVEVSDDEWYEEEHLGYYPDGTQRTLSEEDVKFFRRSELISMLKGAKRRVAERKDLEGEEEERKTVDDSREQKKRRAVEEQLHRQKKRKVQHAKESVPTQPGDLRATDLTALASSIAAQNSAPDTDSGHETAQTPRAQSISISPGDQVGERPESPNNDKKEVIVAPDVKKGKKRKHLTRDERAEDDGVTFRRIARELDDLPEVSIELDY